MKKFFTHSDEVVPVHHPRALVDVAVAQGADRNALFVGTGLTAEALATPETRISYVQFAKLTDNALRLTGNPALGLDYGRSILAPQHGLLGFAMMSSATLGAALELMIRNLRSLAPIWDLSISIRGKHATLTLRETIPLLKLREFSTESTLAALDAIGSALYGRALPVTRMRLAFAAPPYAAAYKQLHDVPMEFGAPETQIEFDASILNYPIGNADPVTAKLAEATHAQQFPPASAKDGLVESVNALLASTHGAPPSLEALARKLQTSPRSLRRFLQSMGTSYQLLLEASRRDRALEWVRSSNLGFDEIATRLGFSDMRSFRRAFKRWTGSTPSGFRDADKAPTG